MPKLSILMPVKNAELYIRRAVASTLRAMPADSELLVLDDGSEDTTPAILEELQTRNLRILHRDRSVGVASGLNVLLSQSDSEFVARMDGDDVCLPWRFVLQMRAIRGNDAIFGGALGITQSGIPSRPTLPGRISPTAMAYHLALSSFLVHPTALFRRCVLPETAYRDVPAEDFDLWLRLVGEGRRLAQVATPLIMMRRHAGQTTRSAAWNVWLADHRAIDAVQASFLMMLSRAGISSFDPQPATAFALGVVAPSNVGRVRDHLAAVEDAGRGSLSSGDFSYLQVRLASARKRLKNFEESTNCD